LYLEEGIKFDPIVFVDSDPVLAMIEKGPNGILPTLDDEGKLPEGNDTKFMDKIEAAFKNNKNFGTATQRKLTNKLSFDIIHYAGSVCYTADEFMSKNKDTFFQDAHDLGATSTHALTSSLFPALDARIQVKSLSSVFRNQLNVLMEKLRTTSTRYVRCIKPNETMSPLLFEAPLVMRQLRYSGVFEAVAIRKQGFPFRQKFAAFAFRYKAINPDHVYRQTDPRKICEEIFQVSPTDFKDIVYGKTMVFYKAPVYKTLKLLRNLALETIIPRVQGILRGAAARVMKSRLKKLEVGIDRAIDLKTDYEALKSALSDIEKTLSSLGKRLFTKYRPRNEAKGYDYLKGLQLWADEEANMTTVLATSISSNYGKYWDAYERCQKILHVAKSRKQTDLYDRLEGMVKGDERGQVDMILFDSRKKMLKTQMQSGVERAMAMNHSSPPLNEARRCLALSPKEWFQLELPAAEACGDSARVKQCKLRLWEIDMAASNPAYARWSNWQGLRPPQEYAKGKWFGKTSYGEGMCIADKAVVNQPLTREQSPEFRKLAKDMNKSILAYCGVKSDSRGADQAACEGLQMASRSQASINEFYCQVFKMATLSPKISDPEIHNKAYQLLGITMYCFVPQDEDLLKHAFMFSIKKDPNYAKCASHGKFDASGAPRSGMDISRIVSEIAAFNSTPSALSLT